TRMIDANGKTWQYTYDQFGDRATVADPLGHTSLSRYDALGRLTAAVQPKGYAAGQRCPTGSPPPSGTPYVTYDTYDGFSELSLVTDPLGHSTQRAYDADRNLTQLVDADDNTTQHAYDLVGEQTSATRGVGTAEQTTS